jgi:hypothetical protein
MLLTHTPLPSCWTPSHFCLTPAWPRYCFLSSIDQLQEAGGVRGACVRALEGSPHSTVQLSCQAAVQPGDAGCKHCHHPLFVVLTIRTADDSGKAQAATSAARAIVWASSDGRRL